MLHKRSEREMEQKSAARLPVAEEVKAPSMVQRGQSTGPAKLPLTRAAMWQPPPHLPLVTAKQTWTSCTKLRAIKIKPRSRCWAQVGLGWAGITKTINNRTTKSPWQHRRKHRRCGEGHWRGGVGSAFLGAWSIAQILAETVTKSTWCTGLGRGVI